MKYGPHSGARVIEGQDPYNIQDDMASAVMSLDNWVGRLRGFIQGNGGIRGAGIDSITQTTPTEFNIIWHDPATGQDVTETITMPTSAGTVVQIKWDGQGSTPPRNFPTGHPLAGQTLPSPPHVVVQWISPVPPTVTPLEGDMWFRVADEVVY